MKNLPYFKGGTCVEHKNNLSLKGHLKELQFNSFEEFCNKADTILYTYTKYKKEIDLISYKEYIYSKTLCDDYRLNNAMKDKCFEWIISLEYEHINKNDLYALLGKDKKGK